MATTCTINKQDSNLSGLSFAEEICFGKLPSTGNGDPSDPVWYGLEPNGYSDFGAENITETRSPIEPSRQNAKGTVVVRNSNGGYNTDVTTDSILTRQMQGFFFADAHEKPSTAPFVGTQINIGAVTSGTKKYAIGSSGITAGFNKAGLIVLVKGLGVASNNGIKTVASSDADDITVNEALTDEADGALNPTIEVVGYEFGTADAAIVKTGSQLALTSTAAVLAGLGLNLGEWIYIGGDAAASADSFANNKGYARVGSIAAGTLGLDVATFAGASEVSTGKKIRIFFGKYIRNENTIALIKRRSYGVERTLGNGPTTTQAEYLIGAVANEAKINVPVAKKLNVDIAYVAADYEVRSGEGADTIKTGTRVAALGADAFNSTSDIYMQKVYVLDPSTAVPTSLFGYLTESSFTISNGVTPSKATGKLGAFDTTTANFTVSGSMTCYFQTVAALTAIKNNADVGVVNIAAKLNTGFVFDMPKVGLGGGRVSIEKDKEMTVPVTPQAAKCPNGYTASWTYFPYLPNVAMPV